MNNLIEIQRKLMIWRALQCIKVGNDAFSCLSKLERGSAYVSPSLSWWRWCAVVLLNNLSKDRFNVFFQNGRKSMNGDADDKGNSCALENMDVVTRTDDILIQCINVKLWPLWKVYKYIWTLFVMQKFRTHPDQSLFATHYFLFTANFISKNLQCIWWVAPVSNLNLYFTVVKQATSIE